MSNMTYKTEKHIESIAESLEKIAKYLAPTVFVSSFKNEEMPQSLKESLEENINYFQHERPIVTNPIQTEIKRKLSTILQAGLTPGVIILGKK